MDTAKPGANHEAADAIVEATLSRVGKRVVLGTPLGLGKANHLVNAFYRRAAADPSIELVIYTALTLAAPRAKSELERRLVEPLVRRVFGGYPEIDWVEPQQKGELPDNVEVREFYFRPGAMLRAPSAQASYISSNYTHVVRDVLDAGINVVAQLVGVEEVDGETAYSLSCNSDLSVDLFPAMRRRATAARPVALLAEVNRELPFFYGDAQVPPATFDAVLDRPELQFPLFGPPNLPVSTADYALAAHASALVKDGGTLQLGIGSLGDAIVHLLRLRHRDTATYRRVLGDLGVTRRGDDLIEAWGGTEPFARGLYAATEMLVTGFLELYRCGVLRRRVYPDAAVQRLVDAGRLDAAGGEEAPAADVLAVLAEEGAVGSRLGAADVERLRRLGLLRPGVEAAGDRLVLGDESFPATVAELVAGPPGFARVLGDGLAGGRVAHSCFFLGPRDFYRGLRELPRGEREAIAMTGIAFVNELFGDEALKRAQRRHARFINSAMMMTLLGAATSDGLDDGRVVSGVGGQYNFVAMAQALEDGRSILMLPATRDAGGDVSSNLRWSYGHTTIPRHLRDLVVTEYGIADLRGKTDGECVAAMLAIADSRFQEELLEKARKAGKVDPGYRIPDRHRENLPERLERELGPHREHFPQFPFGTDLEPEEVVLTRALRSLKRRLKDRDLSVLPDLDDVRNLTDVPDAARPYLARMGLDAPEGARETLLQRAVVYALSQDGAI